MIRAGDVLIVYSQATGRIRRWGVSNTDDELKSLPLASGEAVLQVAKDTVKSGTRDAEALQAFVTAASGKTPVSDRYVVVSGSTVLTAILADPACGDQIPDCELIQHDTADARWTFDPQTRTLTPPPPTREDQTNAAKAALRSGKKT